MTKSLEEKLRHGDFEGVLSRDEIIELGELLDMATTYNAELERATTEGYDNRTAELLKEYSKIFVSLTDDARSSPEVEEMITLLNGVFGY